MKNFWKFLIGGLLLAIGCLVFLYPNYSEWKIKKEAKESFEEMFGDDDTDKTEKETETKTTTASNNYDSNNNGSSNNGVANQTDSDGPAETNIDTEAGTEEESLDAAQNPETETITENDSASVADYSRYSELYQAMVAYNQDLIDNGQKITDAWSYEQTPVEFPNIDADNPIIGYIDIPDMDIRLQLLLGASTDNLSQGAAVLSGTSMPIGGENTNCVIAAHRGWHGNAYFQYIEDLGPGSKVYITTPWETLVYEYRETKIINPDDVDAILIQEGKDMITLFTCHPYQVGGGPYRYLVFCDRVGTQESTIENSETINPKTEEETQGETQELTAESASGNSGLAETEMAALTPTPTLQPKEAVVSETETLSLDVEDGFDMIAVEQTLRIILPLSVIAFAVLILLFQLSGTKRRRGRKKKVPSKSHKAPVNKKQVPKKQKENTGVRLLDKKIKRKRKKEEGNSRR